MRNTRGSISRTGQNDHQICPVTEIKIPLTTFLGPLVNHTFDFLCLLPFKLGRMRQSYPAGEPGLFMVRCHAQSLDKELYSFVDAILIVETQTSNIQCISICRIHSQNITMKKNNKACCKKSISHIHPS